MSGAALTAERGMAPTAAPPRAARVEEVDRTKRRMLAEAVYALDTLSGAAHIFGNALCTGLTVAEVESWPARVAAVTKDAVDAAARFALRPERSVVARLLPGDPA